MHALGWTKNKNKTPTFHFQIVHMQKNSALLRGFGQVYNNIKNTVIGTMQCSPETQV